MIKEYSERAIWLDKNIPPCYGRVKDSNRCCYSVVTLGLVNMDVRLGEPTPKLKGFDPIIYWIPYWWKHAGGFHFCAELNDKRGCIGIRVWFLNADSVVVSFELSREDKIDVLRKLDLQCKRLIGKTCIQMLKEARERMDPKELENIVI